MDRGQTRTNYCEFNGHQESEDIEQGLEDGPFWGLEEPPGAWGKNEGVPGCDCECADEEILVSGEMRGQVEGRGQLEGHCCGDGERAVRALATRKYQSDSAGAVIGRPYSVQGPSEVRPFSPLPIMSDSQAWSTSTAGSAQPSTTAAGRGKGNGSSNLYL